MLINVKDERFVAFIRSGASYKKLRVRMRECRVKYRASILIALHPVTKFSGMACKMWRVRVRECRAKYRASILIASRTHPVAQFSGVPCKMSRVRVRECRAKCRAFVINREQVQRTRSWRSCNSMRLRGGGGQGDIGQRQSNVERWTSKTTTLLLRIVLGKEMEIGVISLFAILRRTAASGADN